MPPAGLPTGSGGGLSLSQHEDRVALAIVAWTTTARADRHGVTFSRSWHRESSIEVDLLLVVEECGVAAAAEKKEKMNVGSRHDSDPIGSCSSYLYVH